MAANFDYQMSQYLEFKDSQAGKRSRQIKREDVTKHPNKNFSIRVIEHETAFQFGFVMDVVAGIKRALDQGRRYVIILPLPLGHRSG